MTDGLWELWKNPDALWQVAENNRCRSGDKWDALTILQASQLDRMGWKVPVRLSAPKASVRRWGDPDMTTP